MRLISFYGIAESRDEPSDSPHPSPLPEGEGTRLLAPFSLGRRVGDEGNPDLNSAMPVLLSKSSRTLIGRTSPNRRDGAINQATDQTGSNIHSEIDCYLL
jgi:hypothetical protein